MSRKDIKKVVKNRQAVISKRRLDRNFREWNPDYMHNYWEAHKEEITEKKRKYYLEHRERECERERERGRIRNKLRRIETAQKRLRKKQNHEYYLAAKAKREEEERVAHEEIIKGVLSEWEAMWND